VDQILEFVKKMLCLRLRRLTVISAELAGDVTPTCLSFPGVIYGRRHASCATAVTMLAACNNNVQTASWCLAAVFSVILKSCNFVTFGQITE